MKKITFMDLSRRYIAHHIKSQERFEKRKPASISAYICKCNLVNDFLISKKMTDLPAIDFTLGLSKQLSEWLSLQKGRVGKPYSHNYMVRVCQICRTVLQFGTSNSLISANPLQYLKIKKTPPAPPPYLTANQLQQLEDYKGNSSMKIKAHAMLVIQLHTGFDYGDFVELKRHHIQIHSDGRKYLSKPRNKNGHEAIIPVSKTLTHYLEKYDFNIRLLSNPLYNGILKDIAKDLELQVHLTSKALRKLFMMNKLNNQGVSMEAVSKMAGHRTIRTTETYYARPNITLISKELDRLGL